MCIILGHNNHPINTKLYTFPILIQNTKANLLLYKNDFILDSGKDNIMIVVVPTDKPIGLVKLQDKENCPANILTKMCDIVGDKIIKYDSNNNQTKSISKNFAEINIVGDYAISVVYSIDDLINKIDWESFERPDDLEQRINTINDKKLFPFDNKAIIICKAIKIIKNSGFGCVYFSDKIIHPTCHQNTNTKNKNYKYDVIIYNMHKNKPNEYIDFIMDGDLQYNNDKTIKNMCKNIGKRFIGKFVESNIKKINEIINNIDVIDSLNGNIYKNHLSLSNKYSYISVFPIYNVYGINQNIYE